VHAYPLFISEGREMNSYKVKRLVEQIYSYFSPHIKKNRRPPIYARDVLPSLKASRATIIKARRLLGITPQKVAGKSRWSYPRFTVDQALGREKKHKYLCSNPDCPMYKFERFSVDVSEKKIRCPACNGKRVQQVNSSLQDVIELREEIKSNGYDAPATYLVKALNRINRTRLYAAKHELGIIHYRDASNTFRWALVSDEVKKWLDETFKSGTVLRFSVLMLRAKKKGWTSEFMLEHCRKETSIQKVIIDHKICWRENPANIVRNPSVSDIEPELPDTGGVISGEDDPAYLDLQGNVLDTNEPDYLSPNKDDRARRWYFLFNGAKRSHKTKGYYTRYRNQMEDKYPEEYKELSDKYVDAEEEVKRLREKIKDLEGRIG
jgi:hypothetical protein